MSVIKFDLYEPLAPQILLDPAFADYTDQCLALLAVDEPHAVSDASSIAYTGRVTFCGEARASPARRYRDLSDAVFDWEDVTFDFRIALPRDDAPSICITANHSLLPCQNPNTVFNTFEPIEKTAMTLPEYPGIRFRLKLLVSALTFHFGEA